MRRHHKKEQLVAEINITPFTDVILVLLIIFMIATPLIYQASIKVNLPEASTALPVKDARQVYITLTEKGLVYLGKRLVTKKELKDEVYSIHKNNPSLEVILRADRLVRFKEVVTVLDILSEFGIKNINVAALTGQQARGD